MPLCMLLCGPKIRNKDLVFLYSCMYSRNINDHEPCMTNILCVLITCINTLNFLVIDVHDMLDLHRGHCDFSLLRPDNTCSSC